MMPIVWRYLLNKYLKIFLLCLFGFIAVLLLTRFQMIARFAASGASIPLLIQFILFQVPHILPLAIPISSAIATFLLFRHLSQTHELTALKTSGMSLGTILYPITVCGLLLGALNFTIASEVSSHCRGQSRVLARKMATQNPFSLLRKGALIRSSNILIDFQKTQSDQMAHSLTLGMYQQSSERIAILLAKNLSSKDGIIEGSDVTLLSNIKGIEGGFDHLIIENQSKMWLDGNLITTSLSGPHTNFGYEQLNFRSVWAKGMDEKNRKENEAGFSKRAIFELGYRISFGIVAITFTLLGAAFGIREGFVGQKKGGLWLLAWVFLYILSFTVAKTFKEDPIVSLPLFFLPNLAIVFVCFFYLRRGARESA